jgi:hypothetical protein
LAAIKYFDVIIGFSDASMELVNGRDRGETIAVIDAIDSAVVGIYWC